MPEGLGVIQGLLSFIVIWILLGAVVPWLWGSWLELYWTLRPWWIGPGLHASPRDLVRRPRLLLRWSRSSDGRVLGLLSRRDAENRIKGYESDHGLPRPAATLAAIGGRTLGELFLGFPWSREIRRRRREMAPYHLKAYLRELIEGWHHGIPAPILRRYLDYIERLAPSIDDDPDLRHGSLCTVAAIRYLLGDFSRGHTLAGRNWRYAGVAADPGDRARFLWMASYAWFNSTLFLGRFDDALDGLTDHWRAYEDDERRRVRQALSRHPRPLVPLDPVISVPRHVILAAALTRSDTSHAKTKPFDDKRYWPDEEAFAHASPNRKEIAWLEAWYHLAKTLCEEQTAPELGSHHERVSLDFSRAYTGFYYTLLLTDPELSEADRGSFLQSAHSKLPEAVDADAPTVSKYTLLGFRGIFELVAGTGAESALRYFRRAAQYSDVSGNSFFNCLFFCCHARAAAEIAARGNRPLEFEADHFLWHARWIARWIARQGGQLFYMDLCTAAEAAVCHLRGRNREGQAKRLAENARSHLGERVFRVFVSEEVQSALRLTRLPLPPQPTDVGPKRETLGG